jgi:hypothetical protein
MHMQLKYFLQQDYLKIVLKRPLFCGPFLPNCWCTRLAKLRFGIGLWSEGSTTVILAQWFLGRLLPVQSYSCIAIFSA